MKNEEVNGVIASFKLIARGLLSVQSALKDGFSVSDIKSHPFSRRNGDT
jgi:hypothetical protein